MEKVNLITFEATFVVKCSLGACKLVSNEMPLIVITYQSKNHKLNLTCYCYHWVIVIKNV